MKNSQFKDRELDLTDLFWKILEQWKALVIIGIIAGLLLSGLMIFKNRRTASESNGVDPEVLNVFSLYADSIDKKEHYTNNFFNKVDLNDCITVTCLYEFNTKTNTIEDESSLGMLNSLYNLILSDDTFRSDMIKELKKYWPKLDTDTLGNIMSFTAVHTVIYGPGTLTFNIIIPKSANPGFIQIALTSCVYEYHDRIEDNVAKDNTIRFVSYAYKQTDYATELSARNSRYSLISSSNSQYKSAYNALDDDTKKLVDDTREACGNSSDPSVYEEYLEEKAKVPRVRIRTLLARYGCFGFLAGVIAYICVYVIFIILVKRVRSDSELERTAGTRNFGGIYKYPYTGFLRKFLHDRKIYAYRARRFGSSLERIDQDLHSKLDFSGIKSFSVISLGKLSEKARAFTDEQIKQLNGQGYEVSLLEVDGPVSSVGDPVFTAIDNVLIELLGNETKWNELIALYSKLKEYDINIIGSEYIEA